MRHADLGVEWFGKGQKQLLAMLCVTRDWYRFVSFFQERLEARFASKVGAAVPGASRMVRFLLCRFCILLQSAWRQGVRQWRMPLVPRCPVLPAGWFSLCSVGFAFLLQSASRQGLRQWRMPLVPRCPLPRCVRRSLECKPCL